MKKLSLFLMFVAVSLFSFADNLTSLSVGDKVIMINADASKEFGGIAAFGSNKAGEAVDFTDAPAGVAPLEIVAGSADGSIAFKTGDEYLAWTSGNTLVTAAEVDASSSWTVTFEGEDATVANVGTPERILSYNSSSPRFACYGNTNQKRVQFANAGEVTPVDPIAVESITLSESALELVEGQKSAKLTVTYAPANANEGKTITWSSDKEEVATVADGVVTAVAAGTATITATTANGKTATCAVTVTAKPQSTSDLLESLSVGDKVIMINEEAAKEFGGIAAFGSNKAGEAVDFSGAPAGVAPLEIVAGSKDGSIAFKNGESYLVWTSGNTLNEESEISDNSSWVVTFEGTDATVTNVADETRILSYNSSSPRFATYGNANQKRVQFVSAGEVTPVDPIAVESITLSESALELVEGQKSAKLTVTYAPANANEGKAITWTSSDEAVATVADGVVTAVAAGTATITATTENGKTATCAVTVTEKQPSSSDLLESLSVGDKVIMINEEAAKEFGGIAAFGSNKAGEAVDFSGAPAGVAPLEIVAGSKDGSIAFKNGESYLVWTSGNTLNEESEISDNSSWVVTFDGTDATVTNVADETRILSYNSSSPRFAAYGNANQKRVQFVSAGEVTPVDPIAVESITLSESALELVEGQKSAKLTVTYAPANANEGKAITWTSSDEAVATVADGVVTAVAAGTATITATTENGKTATCAVTVTEKQPSSSDLLESLSVGDKVIMINEEAAKEFGGIAAFGSNKAGEAVDFSGAPAGVAPLEIVAGSKDGSIAFKNGESYLVWTSGNTLNEESEISDNSSWVVTFEGTDATVTNVADETRILSYNSSSPRFAAYGNANQKRVQFVSAGEVTPVDPIAVESISLSEQSLELVEGQKSAKLTVTYAPANANEGKAITWSSSDEEVATVADGVVTAVAAGTATITATTANGKTATCAVTVTEKQPSSSDLLESLSVGDKVIMINEEAAKEFGGIAAFGSNKAGEAVDFSGAPAGVAPLEIVAGSKDGSIAFKNGESYLVWTSGNTLNEEAEVSDNSSWVVTFDGTDATVTNVADGTRILSYNATNPRFATYGNANQKRVQFVLVSSNPTGVENLEVKPLDLNAPMYNVVGQRVDASYQGIVIQNGQKYLIVR